MPSSDFPLIFEEYGRAAGFASPLFNTRQLTVKSCPSWQASPQMQGNQIWPQDGVSTHYSLHGGPWSDRKWSFFTPIFQVLGGVAWLHCASQA